MTGPSLDDQYRFRSGLLHDLESDLMGPHAADEVIADPPITTYIVGVLYPQSTDPVDPALDDDLGDDDDESVPDPAVSLAEVRYPSSVGLSFAIDPFAAGELRVRIRCGRYEQADETDSRADVAARSRARGIEGQDRPWRRIDVDEWLAVPLGTMDTGTRRPVCDGLALFSRMRRTGDAVAVTLVLINTNIAPPGSLVKDSSSFFQASVYVTAPAVSKPPFVERPAPGLPSDDGDLKSYGLLYRHAKVYAIGHGCAARWQIEGTTDDYVATSYVPTYELRLAVSNPEIELPCLSLRLLAEAPRQQVTRALLDLPLWYRRWIADRPVEGLSPALASTAADHLADCSAAADRMEAGIRVLERDEAAWEAFRCASNAMLTVRSRADWHRAGRPGGAPETGDQSWYPFQLGFLLTCIPGIADRSCPDRELVDLLWFPTGGGKTEAYLGLIAFTVFLRRLRGAGAGAGVTALMRYTLRLLTIQQFERAAALICACELIRRDRVWDLGGEPISLGLWVGGDGTPNTREEAQRQLKKLRANVSIDKGNPVQLKSCPWCGAKLDAWNYYLTHDRGRLTISCPNDDCPFRKGLPVAVVDEDVYDNHPTLVIATADKFAGITWRAEAHKLFNLARSFKPLTFFGARNPAPGTHHSG